MQLGRRRRRRRRRQHHHDHHDIRSLLAQARKNSFIKAHERIPLSRLRPSAILVLIEPMDPRIAHDRVGRAQGCIPRRGAVSALQSLAVLLFPLA